MPAQQIDASLALFGLGTGIEVVLMVLAAFAFGAVIIAAIVLSVWAIALWLSGQRVPSKSAAAATLVAAVVAGPLYMWAYGERFSFWLLPLVIGPFVVANAVLTGAALLRRDQLMSKSSEQPRIQLQTMLLLVAVFGAVLATLAPAFAI